MLLCFAMMFGCLARFASVLTGLGTPFLRENQPTHLDELHKSACLANYGCSREPCNHQAKGQGARCALGDPCGVGGLVAKCRPANAAVMHVGRRGRLGLHRISVWTSGLAEPQGPKGSGRAPGPSEPRCVVL